MCELPLTHDKAVSCEGIELKSEPADSLPMTKQSYLF